MNTIISLLFTIFVFTYGFISVIFLRLFREFFKRFDKNFTVNRYVCSEIFMLIRNVCNDFVNDLRRK